MLQFPIVSKKADKRNSHFVDYVLRGRDQIYRRARSEAVLELSSFEAVTNSKVSMHVAKANSLIKVST